MPVLTEQLVTLRAQVAGQVDEHRRLLHRLDPEQAKLGYAALVAAAFVVAVERRFRGGKNVADDATAARPTTSAASSSTPGDPPPGERSDPPDLAEIMNMLDALEITGSQYDRLLQLAHEAAQKGWWDRYAWAPRQKLYADLEYSAATVREYNQTVMPAVLQAPDFIAALVDLDKYQATFRSV